MTVPRDEPELAFGFRGEGITYRSAGRELEIAFDYMKGARLYTETIQRWNDGATLNDEEKSIVFARALSFVRGHFEKLVVVINSDDSSQPLWKRLCEAHRDMIAEIDYTSDAAKAASLRRTFLPFAQMGKLVIDGAEVRDEKTLDRVLEDLTRKRRGTKDDS